MAEPFFSIIIPTYNRAAFIRKTISSVLSQQYPNFEAIVIDDGSTDDTEAVVSSISDKRIMYYKKINSERGAARNSGIQKATGNFVTFLDSDDLLRDNHLLEAKKFMDENLSADVFSVGYDVVSAQGKVLHSWKTLPSPVNDKLVEGNFLSCLGVFVRRELLLKNLFNEDRSLSGSEDYELWMRIAARYPIYVHNVSTALLVNHNERSVTNFAPDKLINRIAALKMYIASDPQIQVRYGPRLKKLNGYNDLYLALHLAMMKARAAGIRFFMKAFRQHPSMVFKYRFWVVVKKIVLN
jgi:glycosyltransferase involved in cell wall biosynthesis